MSIAILLSVHDGIVLGADSASSLLVPTPSGESNVANVYGNANKIFNLYKGRPIGCVTFGTGSIGNASIATLVKDLRRKLLHNEGITFDPDKYTVGDVANLLATFLHDECAKIQDPTAKEATNIGMLLAGYSSGKPLGEGWSIEIKQGQAVTPSRLRETDQVGINWGGMGEVVQRIVLGFSPALFQVLAETMQPNQVEATTQQLVQQLAPLLSARLQAQIVFAPMPIQDAIDLTRFLVHAAIMYSRFMPGAQVVGGPIEIAAITKHEGFKWIHRKHYYDAALNREPIDIKEPVRVNLTD